MDGYLHYLELARNRQKKYYDAHKDTVKQKKKDERKELKELRAQVAGLGVNPPAPIVCDECAEDHDPISAHVPVAAVAKKGAKPKFDEASVIQALQDATDFRSEATRKNYISNMRQIFRITNCPTLPKCLANFDKIKKSIEEGLQKNKKPYSLNSKKGFFQAIVYIIDHLHVPVDDATKEKYRVLMQVYVGKSKKQTDSRKTDPAFAVMPYSIYMSKIKAEFGEKSKQFLIASLYNEVTVRDDFQLEIVSSEQEVKSDGTNYVVVPRLLKNNCTVVIQSYKTDKKYGVIKVKTTTVLSKQIREWMETSHLTDGNKLFPNKTLSDFVSTMNKSIGAMTGGINYIRQSKISEVLSKHVMSDEDRILFGRRMGHSPLAQLKYVRSIKWSENE
jgi:hypothetical protein